MLLENHRRGDGGLETVSFTCFDQLAKRPHRAAVSLPVVGQRSEVALHLGWSVQPLHQFPLCGGEVFFVGFHCQNC